MEKQCQVMVTVTAQGDTVPMEQHSLTLPASDQQSWGAAASRAAGAGRNENSAFPEDPGWE